MRSIRWFLIVTVSVVLSGPVTAQDCTCGHPCERTVDFEVSAVEDYSACLSIVGGPGLLVASSGVLTLTSGDRIQLGNSVAVNAGATMTLALDTTLFCDVSLDADEDLVDECHDCDDDDSSVFPGAVEECNGVDDNCDGAVDDGNPGGGLGCATGESGVCAAGTTACIGGIVECVRNQEPTAETCNGLDDDCDGATDEGNPGGGGSCVTGQPGVCSAGTTNCVAGALVCEQDVFPSVEVCDGLDNDCDGVTDEGNPGGGVICSTGQQGVCSAGTTSCVAGVLTCEQDVFPSAETCNGLDDDCDGATDEGNPGGGGSCDTGQQGVCSAGTTSCVAGALTCEQNVFPSTETCNGVDDDCDGVTDEGNPGGGGSCDTGLQGVCAEGTFVCSAGSLTCQQDVFASPETCNGLDDDCDGAIDEGGVCG